MPFADGLDQGSSFSTYGHAVAHILDITSLYIQPTNDRSESMSNFRDRMSAEQAAYLCTHRLSLSTVPHPPGTLLNYTHETAFLRLRNNMAVPYLAVGGIRCIPGIQTSINDGISLALCQGHVGNSIDPRRSVADQPEFVMIDPPAKN